MDAINKMNIYILLWYTYTLLQRLQYNYVMSSLQLRGQFLNRNFPNTQTAMTLNSHTLHT